MVRRPIVAALVAALLLLAACTDDDPGATGSTDSTATNPTTTTDVASDDEDPTTSADADDTDEGTVDGDDTDPEADEESTTGAEVCAPGTDSFTLEVEGVRYPVRVFQPTGLGTELRPVVLNWHGLGSNGEQQAEFTAHEDLAELEGYAVVHPTGPPAPGSTFNSWELRQFDVPERDDVAMADALIDRLIAEACVDPNRVYSTGMSNGGLFTSLLLCDLADRIAAAVSVAGVSHPDDCDPTRAVPFAAFHGNADEVVSFDGGGSSLIPPGVEPDAVTAAFFDQVMPDEFAEFAADFGCSPEPIVTELGAEVIEYRYADCTDDAEVVFHEIVDGGHTWPGSPFGNATQEISATEDGWAFLSRHSLDG